MNVIWLMAVLALPPAEPSTTQSVVVVVGAPGTREFEQQFSDWAAGWEEAAGQAKARFRRIGDGGADKKALQVFLETEDATSTEPLWIVLIGHGTFDGRAARFNLRGPDVTAEELKGWLERFERPLAIVNCSSSSGPFIHHLSGPNRVVATATKSGFEHNYARFGGFFSAAMVSTEADLDKDGQTSLLEAFLSAARQSQDFYKNQARLATEHALLDDNGDGRGTPAEWYRGVRATRNAKDGSLPDGPIANQWCLVRSQQEADMAAEVRAQRDALELDLERLRREKPNLDPDEYYRQLESVLVQLARLYGQGEAANSTSNDQGEKEEQPTDDRKEAETGELGGTSETGH